LISSCSIYSSASATGSRRQWSSSANKFVGALNSARHCAGLFGLRLIDSLFAKTVDSRDWNKENRATKMGCGASTPERTGVDNERLMSSADESDKNYKKESMQSVQDQKEQPTKKEKKPKPSSSNKGPHATAKNAPPPAKKAPQPPAPPKAQEPAPQGLPSAATPINRAHDRVDAIEKSRTVTCGGVKMTYAYISQRGFYPDDPFKANQDAYCVNQGVVPGKADMLFGVFDGHGKDGDGCAIYAKNHLPPNVGHYIGRQKPKKGDKELGKAQIQNALHKAHVETNKALHKNANVDDTLSGTTAISLYMHGSDKNRITIANVGDSRAVLGQEANSSGGASSQQQRNEGPRTLKALALSRDQTPYRKDERARVRKCGARVLSLDQLEGLEPIIEGASEAESLELGEELDEGGDPPRIWAPNGDYPGTAFTRSIGDSVAEELGVYAEPEMLTREIMPEDKIIVLASDGVFEFLTNQSVIDICCKFNDPLEACRAVVAEAYELWLQYEMRTDDITIITIYVDEVQLGSRRLSLDSEPRSEHLGVPAPMLGQPDTYEDEVGDAAFSNEELRPVRKHVSKKTSKAIEKMRELGKTMHGDEGDDNFDWRKHATEKTQAEKNSIAEAIKASVMFRNTNDAQREMIFACMESVDVTKGTWVIRQGSVGDRFYIVDEGQFEVRIVPDGEDDVTGQGGHIVHIYDGSRQKNAHPSFGELALVSKALVEVRGDTGPDTYVTCLSPTQCN
jgi:serine/threonine protein phosphatase PrpC